MTRDESLKIIYKTFGMNEDLLRETIGYSTDPSKYSDGDLYVFAKYQIGLKENQISFYNSMQENN